MSALFDGALRKFDCLLFQIVRHAELLTYVPQALQHRRQQRDAALGALLRRLKFNFAGDVNTILPGNRRR